MGPRPISRRLAIAGWAVAVIVGGFGLLAILGQRWARCDLSGPQPGGLRQPADTQEPASAWRVCVRWHGMVFFASAGRRRQPSVEVSPLGEFGWQVMRGHLPGCEPGDCDAAAG